MAADPTPPEPSEAAHSDDAGVSPGGAPEPARGASDPVAGGAVSSAAGVRARRVVLPGLSLVELCARMAADEPSPGAGSGAASVGALGASLVAMAFRRSAREGASAIPAYMAGRADQLEALRDELLRLVDADAEAYAAFLAARAEERSGDAARAKRRATLERAARAVVEVPFEVLEDALAALRLAAVGAPDQHPNLMAETAAGAAALGATIEACARIVRDNLPVAAAESEAFAEEHERALPALERETQRLLAEVRTATAPRVDA